MLELGDMTVLQVFPSFSPRPDFVAEFRQL
jgi:hypothetical protein